MADYFNLTKQLMPWLPGDLVAIFANTWAETGDPELAIAEVRQSPKYELYFPGNKREDGSIYLDEAEYKSTTEGYAQRFAEFGLGGDFMRDRYKEFIQAGKSPDELEEDLSQIYVEVIGRGDAVRQYYAEQYGNGSLSDSAIFASALDPDISPLVFERRFRSSQIGGEAARFGFDLARQQAERLFSHGLDDQASRELFSLASQQLPTLRTLQSRFDDPNDELTIDQFADAVVINDPKQLSILNRLFSQERAQFSDARTQIDQLGRLSGLRRF